MSVAAAITTGLATRPRNVVDVPIVSERPGWTARLVPLIETGGPPPPVYVTWLQMKDPIGLVQHDEVLVLFATGGKRVRLRAATLAVLGTPCTYRSAVGAHLSNNQTLPLIQRTGCNPLHGTPTGQLKLTVETRSRTTLSVWAFDQGTTPGASDANPVEIIGLSNESPPFPLLLGRYLDEGPASTLTRADLLWYTWQISTPSWIWSVVGVAIILLGLGLLLFPMASVPAVAASRGLFAMKCSGSALLVMSSLALLYAVLTPPLEAPDEPDHFEVFARISGRDWLVPEVHRLADIGHLQRIRFRGDEHLRPVDLERPLSTPFKDDGLLQFYTLRQRGTANISIWRMLQRFIPDRPAAETLLMLRLLHALVLSLSVAISVLVISLLVDAPFPQTGGLVFFLVPTLPFMGMHVSNHALLISGYTLIASAVLVLSSDSLKADRAGVLLGVGCGVAFVAGTSSLPLLPLIVTVLMARALMGSRAIEARARSTFIFWMGLLAALPTAALLAAPNLTDYLAQRIYPELPQAFRLPQLWRHPSAIVITIALAGVGAESAIAALRSRLPETGRDRIKAAVRVATIAVLSLMVLTLVGSLFADYPRFTPFGPAVSRDRYLDYLQSVLLVGLTSFRLTAPDYFLISSFWGSFGWLDTILPPVLIGTLQVATGCAFVVFTAILVRLQMTRRLLWIMAILAGAVVSLGLYAIVIARMSPDIHGRYVFGLYLSVLTVSWSGLMYLPTAPTLAGFRWAGAALTACVVVHTYSLSVILNRYFG